MAELQEDAIYVAPDGRRFRAKLEKRRSPANKPAWIFLPARWEDEEYGEDILHDKVGLLDRVSRMLFVERDRIIRLDFEQIGIVVDTGWTVNDLRLE
jgi:hypothetical protein